MRDTGPETQPPGGQTLNYHGFTLTELFLREDLQKLDEGLRRFLGEMDWAANFDHNRTLETLRGFLAGARTAFFGIGDMNLGYVFRREAKGRLLPLGAYTELPPYVYSLYPWLHHPLPSVVALTVFVNLEAAATEQLNTILNRTYGSEERLEEGVTYYPPATIKAQDVQNCVWDIRRSIESVLASYVRGVFLSVGDNTLPLCPAIDVLSLHHIPMDDDEETAKWLEQNDRFLRCIGIWGVPERALRYDEYRLFQSRFPVMVADPWERDHERSFRVLSCLGLFETDKWKAMYGSPEGALVSHGQEVFRDVGLIHALSNLLNLEADAVAELRSEWADGYRENIEKEGASLRKLEDRFKRLHLLQSSVHAKSFHLTRLGHELESQKRFMADDLPEFKRIKLPSGGRKQKPFPENVLEFMNYHLSLLQDEIRILEGRLTDEIGLTSARLNLELAFRMDKLTVLMTILAVASVVMAVVSMVMAVVSILPGLSSVLRAIVSSFAQY